ncbi:hypothetical protein WA026_009155 [Henosepilachna vigintioctopunctata]|uniref:Uncharacterized protein n=1 Tax=Henosepilachna vigintioctopunctata TaxID=420089 RepID=A0AAW1UQ16_9CUCU
MTVLATMSLLQHQIVDISDCLILKISWIDTSPIISPRQHIYTKTGLVNDNLSKYVVLFYQYEAFLSKCQCHQILHDNCQISKRLEESILRKKKDITPILF